MTNIIKNFTNTLNTFRAQAKIIRKMFSEIVVKTATKMSNGYAAVKYYQAKILDINKRQKATFQLALYFADSMKMTLESLVNGPVLGLAKFFPTFGIMMLIEIAICIVCIAEIPFVSWVACPICMVCFKDDTQILMNDHTKKNISNIKINEITNEGGMVSSTLIFKIKGKYTDVYNYKGTIVSGSHLVLDNGINRIENTSKATLLDNNPDHLYCIINDKHRLVVNNIKYTDFHESSCNITNKKTIMLVNMILNPEITNLSYIPTYQWGFGYGTKILLDEGNTKNIENIILGDKLLNGFEVYGIIKHSSRNTEFYQLGNVVYSGNQFVLYNDKWMRCYLIKEAIKITYKLPYFYSIVCDNHYFYLENGERVRDYLELEESHKVFNKIHQLNLESVKNEI